MKTTLLFLFIPFVSVVAQSVSHTRVSLIPKKHSTYFKQQAVYLHFSENDGLFSKADTSNFKEGILEAYHTDFSIASGKILRFDFEIYNANHRRKKLPVCKVYTAPEFGSLDEIKLTYVGTVKRNGKFRLEDGRTHNKYFFIAAGYPPLEISFRHIDNSPER